LSAPLDDLLRIMRQLRDERDGCAWDRRQTFSSIAPSTLEEAYEVVDAIERGNFAELKGELGDLLFQVVFHSQMASEQRQFDFDDVAAAICDKLVRRHPHVFANGRRLDAEQQSVEWENIKARERAADTVGAAADSSHLAGVPRALPALTRAVKLSKRAARVGFDWDKPEQTADKVAEELGEVLEAIRANRQASPSANVFEEVGDLLFAAANLARKLNVDAEAALRAANSKFERRFRHIEAAVRERGAIFEQLPLETLEELWLSAKRAELNGT
jgi:nucleoside triphosphate diphosphatase